MHEQRILQAVVAAACLVPILGGGSGVLLGPAFVKAMPASAFADSHYRYLSGLLLAIGILFLGTLPRIEARTARFRLLAGIVVIGGLARLAGLLLHGEADLAVLFALVMELGVTPALVVWQSRVAAAHRRLTGC